MKLENVRKISGDNFSIGSRQISVNGFIEYLIINDEGDYVMHAPTRLVDELDGLAELDVILDELAVQHSLALDASFDKGVQTGTWFSNEIAIAIETAASAIAHQRAELSR